MFGLLRPCSHGAARYGIDGREWFAQLCGLCLGLRDGHGQLARAATNTDAVVLTLLTEAQQPRVALRTAAGRCPLRGMQRATVAAAGSPGVRLAATASLLLGAAKVADRVTDGEAGFGRARPFGAVSKRWFTHARSGAEQIGLDIEPLIEAIEQQARVEELVCAGTTSTVVHSRPQGLGADPLAALTRASQMCAAELFAHSAVLAGRPENAAPLREAGWHFGRIAHLADALEDLAEDERRGRFNPLTATGTVPEQAYGLLRESQHAVREGLRQAGLADRGEVRWLLLDPLRSAIQRIGRLTGTACATGKHACGCGTSGRKMPEGAGNTAALLGYPVELGALDFDGPRAQYPGGPGPDGPQQNPGSGSNPPEPGRISPPFGGEQNAPQPWPSGQWPNQQQQYEEFPPSLEGSAGFAPPSEPPDCGAGIGIVCTQYCTGYACCHSHRDPCNGGRRRAILGRCCDDCDCDCGDCGDCCSCCDGDCCCDCDCGCDGCDCNC